ncbi:MAG TPA: HAD family hydrolase [Clostridia bacterium]|nr:HAD family hydrolase [Clostridia bacterium]
MYNYIIFDVDGTLIDTEKAVEESYRSAIFEETGRRLTADDISKAYGIPTVQAFERLGVSNVERACEIYYDCLFKAFREVKPFEGVGEMLAEVKRLGLGSGIVTSRNRGEVANDASLQGLLKYIDHVICVEDTQKHKPDAEPVLKLLEIAGRDTSEAVYLGDTVYDYMCAKNAGVGFALAAWGASRTEGIDADYVLEKPWDMITKCID